MKATIEFNLPEDASAFHSANHASAYFSALHDIYREIRTSLKHGGDEVTPHMREKLEVLRELIPNSIWEEE